MTVIQYLKNKLYIFYLSLLGSLIIGVHLYFRLFRSHDNYSLDVLRDTITTKGLLLSISFIFIQVLVITSVLYLLYKQYYNIQKTSKFIQLLLNVIDYIYWKPLEYIHDLIAPDLPYSGTVIIWITEYMEKGNQILRYKLYRHSYILFDYLPQIVVSSIFFIDTIILNQLYYFLYAIILLLIPLCYKIYIKLCSSFITRNEPGFLNRLNIVFKGVPDAHGIYLQWDFSLKPKYISEQAYLSQYIKDYLNLQRIALHVKHINVNSAKYYPYIILFTSSVYLTAAVYRLMYILF
jgi:hypothetical protein